MNNVLHFHKVNCTSENKNYFVRNFILKYKKAKNETIFIRNEDNFPTKSLKACSEIITVNIEGQKKIRSVSYEALK